MKIIFLDIDGVLNCEEWYSQRKDPEIMKAHSENYPICEFSPILMARLNLLIEKTDAKVVVSSTWRLGKNIQALQELLNSVGFKGEVIGKTESFNQPYVVRGNEIKYWLDSNTKQIFVTDLERPNPEYDIESYVILDDDSDMLLWQKDNFVKTHWKFGFTDSCFDKALNILNKTA